MCPYILISEFRENVKNQKLKSVATSPLLHTYNVVCLASLTSADVKEKLYGNTESCPSHLPRNMADVMQKSRWSLKNRGFTENTWSVLFTRVSYFPRFTQHYISKVPYVTSDLRSTSLMQLRTFAVTAVAPYCKTVYVQLCEYERCLLIKSFTANISVLRWLFFDKL